MTRRILRVNIYNKGQFYSMKTPAYNVPVEEDIYKLMLELGFNIEIYDPSKEKVNSKIEVQEIDAAAEESEKMRKAHNLRKRNFLNKRLPFDNFIPKDVYTEEELDKKSRQELFQILNARGHIGKRTGKRDPLAPKYDDNKIILREKVLKTNLK